MRFKSISFLIVLILLFSIPTVACAHKNKEPETIPSILKMKITKAELERNISTKYGELKTLFDNEQGDEFYNVLTGWNELGWDIEAIPWHLARIVPETTMKKEMEKERHIKKDKVKDFWNKKMKKGEKTVTFTIDEIVPNFDWDAQNEHDWLGGEVIYIKGTITFETISESGNKNDTFIFDSTELHRKFCPMSTTEMNIYE